VLYAAAVGRRIIIKIQVKVAALVNRAAHFFCNRVSGYLLYTGQTENSSSFFGIGEKKREKNCVRQFRYGHVILPFRFILSQQMKVAGARILLPGRYNKQVATIGYNILNPSIL
jgi:hypothetical protein